MLADVFDALKSSVLLTATLATCHMLSNTSQALLAACQGLAYPTYTHIHMYMFLCDCAFRLFCGEK